MHDHLFCRAPGATHVGDTAHVLHNSGSVMIIASEAQKLLIKSLRTECTALSLVLIVRDVETGI
jgi:hypothetical protein